MSSTAPGLSKATRVQSDRIDDYEVSFLLARCNGTCHRLLHVVERTGRNDDYGDSPDYLDDDHDIVYNDDIGNYHDSDPEHADVPRVPNR